MRETKPFGTKEQCFTTSVSTFNKKNNDDDDDDES